ncbi:GTPase domain-containing protein [Nakamurella flava]|uniref:GTPase domain-containing protein n=1 Tax=Nakamurella flava TaxID=2576308 RepID=A0A4U6QC41_9ACTN|nr:GTPase domain-containing protein [Nakamurella flava]TKV57644.1 GTPase domain-containing protein [Nakamurella flava]
MTGTGAAASPSGPVAALTALREELRRPFPGLVTAHRDAARRTADELADQIDDYLLPRLADLDAPLLAVVGGSTGAGKSTLVNSLIGAPVTVPGVLRPTTRSPVIVCHPGDRAAFAGDRVLPGLARTTGGPATAAGSGLHLVTTDTLPPGLAVLDAPDVDSVVQSNRDLAGQLLAAADLWIFVTTAARYADAVPWDVLRTARDRGTALAVVLDRVPPEAADAVAPDLAGLLDRAGLAGTPLFVVAEHPLGPDGMLAAAQVGPLRSWLYGLAADAEQRAAVVRQTLDGALASLTGRMELVAAGVEEQIGAAAALRDAATDAYRAAEDRVDRGVRDGSLLRGEVLARWQEFVGTGEWMRGLQSGIGRLRDRIGAAFGAGRAPAVELDGAVESGVVALLHAAADGAAERTVTAWRALPGGSALLDSPPEADRELSRAGHDLPEAAARSVRDWQGAVLDLVRAEGAGKRNRARMLSWGVNGAGGAAMVSIFAATAGLSGAELAVAGGTTVAGQRVLEAALGDAAVRSLADRARRDLLTRSSGLLSADQDRFLERLRTVAPDPDAARRLRDAAAAVDRTRRGRR